MKGSNRVWPSRALPAAPSRFRLRRQLAGAWLWLMACLVLAAPARSDRPVNDQREAGGASWQTPERVALRADIAEQQTPAQQPDTAQQQNAATQPDAALPDDPENLPDAPANAPDAPAATAEDGDAAAEAAPAAAAPLAGPRPLLKLLGVSDSHFRSLRSGRPLVPDEQEAVWRVLFALRRFTPGQIHAWQRPGSVLSRMMQQPDRYQGEMVRVAGRVLAVERVPIIPEVQERFAFKEYYACTLRVEASPITATCLALRVPRAWLERPPLDERAECAGVFLKVAAAPEGPQAVLACQRLRWYQAGLLGELGFDAGLWDDVRVWNPRLPANAPRHERLANERSLNLNDEDRECFYELLAALARISPRKLLARAEQQPSMVELFNHPARQQGKLVAVTGVLRRAVLVRVEDADVAQRLRVDHYYELEVYPPEAQGNPLVFCVRRLPPGLVPGEKLSETVRVAGVFFKSWGFVPRGEPEGKPRRKQVAPLLIGLEPQLVPPPSLDRGPAAAVAVVVLLLGVAALLAYLWYERRTSERFRQRVLLPRLAEDSLLLPPDAEARSEEPAQRSAPPE